MISVVVETWNLARDGEASAPTLQRLVAALAPQLAAADAELVITHVGAAVAPLAHAATWVNVGREASYYEHKNRGFDAARGDVVAFIDGDCLPSASWLAAIVAPIATHGAQVVAGFTTYPGPLAAVANHLDFPYFATAGGACVRNFFANNVAFARAAFAERRYPAIAPMFHGQCQVLGLQLRADGIAIRFASDARVEHAPPHDLRAWFTARLLRGADTAELLPHVVARYAPRAAAAVDRLGPLPALAALGARAITGAIAALRRGPAIRGLALVASCTVVDAVGALGAPIAYRRLT